MRLSTFSHRRFLISLSCIGIGLLVWGLSPKEKEEPIADKTLWIVDNSMSMQVEDIKDSVTNTYYSRLQVARSIVSSGIAMLPGEHAIIAYARSPGVIVPFASDREKLLTIARNISPVMDNGGSDIGAAFTLVSTLYAHQTDRLHIVLLTDGGDSGTGDYPALPDNMDISIVGIGTDSGGPITLGYDALGQRRYKIYQGKEIHVPYEKKNIEKLQKFYNAHTQALSGFSGAPDISYLARSPIVSSDSPYRASSEWIASVFLLFGLLFSPYVSLLRK